ncbi:hypothetical protein V8C42DRAFT_330494 [Trichoderma barbatum]
MSVLSCLVLSQFDCLTCACLSQSVVLLYGSFSLLFLQCQGRDVVHPTCQQSKHVQRASVKSFGRLARMATCCLRHGGNR